MSFSGCLTIQMKTKKIGIQQRNINSQYMYLQSSQGFWDCAKASINISLSPSTLDDLDLFQT